MNNASKRLVILHTNDIHSCFENMPKLAGRIGKYRAQYSPDQTLVIDCGDHMDRVRLETEGSGGVANVEVMNETGYDVFVPGNNEGLTFPKAAFEHAFRERAKFTVLGTNMRDLQTGSVPPWMTGRYVTVKDGIRIGMVGVTASFNDFYHPLGWDIIEPLQAVQEAVSELRESVDILVVISHVGIRFDRKMAEEISGIDCIIGGHTHHLFEHAERIGTTLIGAAGKSGAYLGVIEVEMDAESRKLLSVSGRAEAILDEQEDERISALIETFRASSLQTMGRTIAVLAEPLVHDPLAESDFGNLLAGGIRKWTNSEIGIVNAGQLLNGLAAGRLTDADLLSICPSPINPCSSMLRGNQIYEALEAALVSDFISKEIRGYGFRGKVLGTLSISEIEVEYDDTLPDYRKIKRVLIQNEPLCYDRLYKVGTIDMFTFGVGYPTLGAGEHIQYYLPEFIRDIIRQELTDPQSILSSKERHWKQL